VPDQASTGAETADAGDDAWVVLKEIMNQCAYDLLFDEPPPRTGWKAIGRDMLNMRPRDYRIVLPALYQALEEYIDDLPSVVH
jgi:hypothetical protein